MHDVRHTETPSDESHKVLYRNAAITGEHTTHFAYVLLRELFGDGDSHYCDAVHGAYLESGIRPVSRLACESIHAEAFVERVVEFGDSLRSRPKADEQFVRSVERAVSSVLNQITVIARDTHLTPDEAAAFVQCCTRGGIHMEAYETYATLQSHVATCARCAQAAAMPA